MSSENENIEEMDNLIRNSSLHEEYSMQEGDWEQLQMMMNEDDRRKNIGWLWRDLLVLVITSVCFAFANNGSPINKGMERIISTTSNEIIRINGLELNSDTDLNLNDQNALSDNTKQHPETLIAEQEQPFYPTAENKQTEGGDQFIEESKGDLGNINKNVSLLRAEDENQTESTRDIEGNLSLLEESNVNVANSEKGEKGEEVREAGEGEGEGESIEQEIAETPHQDTIAGDPIDTVTESELTAENLDTESRAVNSADSNTVTEKVAHRKMHVYFGLGTEWSVASKMPVGPTKLKLQLGGEYQFLKNWSVLSGVNYTVKDYQTNAEDYTVKPGFWTNGIKPSRISAECNVLEVPLNIRYYFNAQDSSRSSFFLTAGASSYLMASEKYNFIYDVADPTLKQGWNGKWENIHYFSALHFSAGYQKSLRKNCSVLVEPYVDLPLNGIGFGQIDLISFGLSLQFKY